MIVRSDGSAGPWGVLMQSGQLVVRWVQERVVLLFLTHWFGIVGIGMMKFFVIESFVGII
jgi:hypothetical protein